MAPGKMLDRPFAYSWNLVLASVAGHCSQVSEQETVHAAAQVSMNNENCGKRSARRGRSVATPTSCPVPRLARSPLPVNRMLSVSSTASSAAARVPGEAAGTHEGTGRGLPAAGLAGVERR